MDTLPLPPRPNLSQYRKRAKDLVAAVRSGDERAVVNWSAKWLSALLELLDGPVTPFVRHSMERALQAIERQVRDHARSDGDFSLADAQFLIARAHSFESWAVFARHVERNIAT